MADWTTPRKQSDGEIVSRSVLQTELIDNVTHLYEIFPTIGVASGSTGGNLLSAAWFDLADASVTITITKVADVYIVGRVLWRTTTPGDARCEFRAYNSTGAAGGVSTGKLGSDNVSNWRAAMIMGYFADVAAGSKTFVLQGQGISAEYYDDVAMVAVALYEQ